jgi:hypothetical protein
MSVAEWRPLSQRLEGLPATAWRGEVPAALVKPLREWVDGTLRVNDGLGAGGGIAERVLLRLDLVPPEDFARRVDATSGEMAARRFLAYHISVNLLPDVVDAVLYLLPVPLFAVAVKPSAQKSTRVAGFMASVAQTAAQNAVDRANSQRVVLAGLLDDALSVLRVQPDGRGLERRADASGRRRSGRRSGLRRRRLARGRRRGSCGRRGGACMRCAPIR